MDFSRRKVPSSELNQFYRAKIDTVSPYAMMVAPVYVLLRENEKLVAVKGPLDFFTPKELIRLDPYQDFYFPNFIDVALPYREAGRKVRELLKFKFPSVKLDSREIEYREINLPLSSYELSDQILKIVGPLWWLYDKDRFGIEPFLIAVFVNELCDLFTAYQLTEARERSVHHYDHAVMFSSLVVFFALHVGYHDLSFLNRLRNKVFETKINGEPLVTSRNSEVDELLIVLGDLYGSLGLNPISVDDFVRSGERTAQKLGSRIERVKREMKSSAKEAPSIFGSKGFIDV